MFTLKIYASGNTFLRACSDIRITNNGSDDHQEECDKLLTDYKASGLLDDLDPVPGIASKKDLLEYHSNALMPFAIIHHKDPESGVWYLHGADKAYIINEQGKTVEQVRYHEPLVGEPVEAVN